MSPEEQGKLEAISVPDYGHVILVAEDEVMLRMAIADHLRKAGFTVVEASSAQEAQALFTLGAPVEAVFLDACVPDLRDGVEMALWLAHIYPDIPVVMASGHDGAVRAASMACGNVRRFLRKPYAFSEVEAVLRELLEQTARQT